MTSRHVINRNYTGLERRSTLERRAGRDRRNLMRFDSLGSDRREGLYRRYEDLRWEENMRAHW